MNKKYFAKHPRPSFPLKSFLNALTAPFRAIWNAIIPYGNVEPPNDLPDTPNSISNEQLGMCQWMFDQAESRGSKLEEKAQWAFGLISFLIPILVSAIAYNHLEGRIFTNLWTVTALILSAICLLFSFISAIRAVYVKNKETLFIGSVIDCNTGDFLSYKKDEHARGLLYCAAVNTAMNDHVAQFVKNTYLLTLLSILLFATGGITLLFSNSQQQIVKTEIISPIKISTESSEIINYKVSKLTSDIKSTIDERAISEKNKEASSVSLKLDQLIQRTSSIENSINVLKRYSKNCLPLTHKNSRSEKNSNLKPVNHCKSLEIIK